MKNKIILSVLTLAACVGIAIAVPPVTSDLFRTFSQQTVGTFTNGNSIATSTTVTNLLPVSDYVSVGLDFSFNMASASAANTGVYIYKGLTASTLETTASTAFNLVQNGTATVNYYTNLSIPSEGVISIVMSNGSASVIMSNAVVTRGFKAYRIQTVQR